MRFVVYGAGAVGGVLGARLFEAGQEVVLIARGAHYAAMRDRGLRLETPTGSKTLAIPVAPDPAAAAIRRDDVVVLAMKSQDTSAALDLLRDNAPPDVAIVCAQNGVSNEPAALRHYRRVYGMCVVTPAAFMDPGVVQAFATPTAFVDIGCFPRGCDATATAIASAFERADCSSVAVPDIMRWKYGKLLGNLHNAVDACCGMHRAESVVARAREEGVEVLEAAGIAFTSPAEEGARRSRMRIGVIEGRDYGVSTVQSLARGTGSVEVDHLNGEIVLLGRLHGVATPVNEALQRIVNRLARAHVPPGSMTVDELEAEIGHEIGRGRR
jgi:2-dehydropantoate 2-reductase